MTETQGAETGGAQQAGRAGALPQLRCHEEVGDPFGARCRWRQDPEIKKGEWLEVVGKI